MPQPKNTTRITVDLSPEMYEMLCKLEESTAADSKAEVVRKALRLYQRITRETAEGTELRLRRGTEEVGLVIF